MPAYDYRCETCGLEFELTHPMSELITQHPHQNPETELSCDGPLERLISKIGVNRGGRSESAPSDDKLKRLGFTKYVRGSKGYDKAFGSDKLPGDIQRES